MDLLIPVVNPMKIRIYRGHTPSMDAADVCVAIDVIRAFTTTQVAFARGVSEILLAAEIDEAFALQQAHERYLLAGERDAIKIDGFDFGNSPAELVEADIAGRGLILTTTNGVRAALHARRCAPTLVCGYRGARAVIQWLRNREVERINLLASHPDGDEDLACAEYLRAALLELEGPGPEAVERRIRRSDAAQKFLDPDRLEFDPRDIAFCAARADDGFVMQVVEADGAVTLEKALAESRA